MARAYLTIREKDCGGDTLAFLHIFNYGVNHFRVAHSHDVDSFAHWLLFHLFDEVREVFNVVFIDFSSPLSLVWKFADFLEAL